MLDIDKFQELREECHKIVKRENESILQEWLNRIGYPGIVGYYRDICNHVLELYTQHPGWLIGKEGNNVAELKYMLSEKFGGEWEIKFIEIRGGFVKGGKI